ncbi:MAG: DUF2828 family protein [Clostridium sp.]|uniref:DUF2828 family protein n=1 Tax=Clostridium sp. TaxID=1506 RepID=UPI003F2DB08D
MKFLNKVKTFLNDDGDYLNGFDPKLDEFDYTIEGDFLFDNEKYQTLFFYNHLLSVTYNKSSINIEFAVAALEEDKDYFFKLISYLRDRKGLKNKVAFRYIINQLADNYPEEFKLYVKFIPKYGRYDDLYEFFYTEVENTVATLFQNQLIHDIDSESPSNLAKWLKSTNASNKKNNALGKRTAKMLSMDYKTYRKTLSTLRKKLNVVESYMSTNKWSDIKYGALTQNNLRKYSSSFLKHDPLRFNEFIYLSSSNKKENLTLLKSNNFMQKYDYLDLLTEHLKNNSSLEVYSKAIKFFYRTLNTEKETWLPVILLNNENQARQSTSNLEHLFVSTFFLCTNSDYYKNYIIKSNGTTTLKRINNFNLNEIVDLIKNVSISKTISIESVFDLLLLSYIKKQNENIQPPNGVVFSLEELESITDITQSNICSDIDKIAFLYNQITDKWLNFNIPAPKLKIWVNEENYTPTIIESEDKKIMIIKGTGEKVFRALVNLNVKTAKDLTHSELKEDLIQILSNKRYDFGDTFQI